MPCRRGRRRAPGSEETRCLPMRRVGDQAGDPPRPVGERAGAADTGRRHRKIARSCLRTHAEAAGPRGPSVEPVGRRGAQVHPQRDQRREGVESRRTPRPRQCPRSAQAVCRRGVEPGPHGNGCQFDVSWHGRHCHRTGGSILVYAGIELAMQQHPPPAAYLFRTCRRRSQEQWNGEDDVAPDVHHKYSSLDAQVRTQVGRH
mmetsp:Transcript_23246/g.54946  ORF Transcript_23246/g.54946 Transcript_23246/m.54946 type:complete len:202 (+) Transcript_23246:154-759(+)